jgi:ribonuclease III
VHDSYLNEAVAQSSAKLESNERLEFLGDRVVGLSVSEHVFQKSEGPEGELSRYFDGLVNDRALAEAARRLQLGRYLVMGKGEESSGGRERDTELAACYEALLGAVFLEFGYEQAFRFVVKSLIERNS